MTSRLDEPRVRGSRRAFPLIEGVLVATGLAVLTWFVTAKYYQGEVDDIRFGYQYFAQASMEERDPLEARYGPQRFSRGAEEWIIRDFFQDRRDGVFLDVGANHYRDQNNTYYLGANASPFLWMSEHINRKRWVGYGQDTKGSFFRS